MNTKGYLLRRRKGLVEGVQEGGRGGRGGENGKDKKKTKVTMKPINLNVNFKNLMIEL